MAKICTNEKTAGRQQWIENGLLELMQEKRFEEISVTDLCRYLGLSRRSFYRYFRDMEDVLDSLMGRTLQNMVITDQALGIRELEENYRFWLGQKTLLAALGRSGMYGKLVEYTLRYTDEAALKGYLSREDMELNLTGEMRSFVVSGSASLLISWYMEGFRKTPEEMARIAYRMLYRPLLTET